MFNDFFFENGGIYERMSKNMVGPEAADSMAHARCKYGNTRASIRPRPCTHTHTHAGKHAMPALTLGRACAETCNTYCFSTATMRFDITLYVCCLSCIQ
jgi:hypothetical protein